MVSYWLAITNHENWDIVKKKNIWGVAKRHLKTIERVKEGDTLLIYVSRKEIDRHKFSPVVITGVFEITSSVFQNYSPLFKTPDNMKKEIFPYRIKLKTKNIFKEPIEFKSLVPKLNFIKNKEFWGLHIRGRAMRSITEEDYNLICENKK
ncbi:MAG: EVE domain-containing protein [Methanoregula sp.]